MEDSETKQLVLAIAGMHRSGTLMRTTRAWYRFKRAIAREQIEN